MIYDKPVKMLMRDFANQRLTPGKIFSKSEPVSWFSEHYPKIKRATIMIHVDAMSTNAGSERKHHKPVRPGSGHDLFFKISKTEYRLWEPESDPAPVYGDFPVDSGSGTCDTEGDEDDGTDSQAIVGESEFAFERDLRNYLARNLLLIEDGLRLYDEEGVSGIEFPVGGRFIDILATDRDGNFLVIELKVSRGYDRTIGQILRYMGWIKSNLASPTSKVRGLIVANKISDDLKIATSLVPDIHLAEYQLKLDLRVLE